ncbi:probable monogalactosyldiacylglycerol synthase 3, chloroplastic [Papaver somniferum]|uniref:probable monogalactosyldiacylglycerol synthase 3, chloroplastic n=1 Tax=Papaver somniferum TaxID=3469 RepID=UPI000E6FC74A|nr:probable monogalactosyldiacylglycerol synthase 3, chloroplastic [Papaver somniferum]
MAATAAYIKLKWKGLQKKVVFVIVITDLNTCHRTWFNTGVNRCDCHSDEVAKRALVDGPESSQIRVFGLPVRPSFCRPVKKTAKALREALFNAKPGKAIGQIIIICGRNKILASTLETGPWKVPLKIRGFETQMEKWMGSCDCIITKAGSGTITEALIRGLPIMKQWLGSCIAGSGVVLVQSFYIGEKIPTNVVLDTRQLVGTIKCLDAVRTELKKVNCNLALMKNRVKELPKKDIPSKVAEDAVNHKLKDPKTHEVPEPSI